MTIVHQSSPLAHCLCPFALLCRLKEEEMCYSLPKLCVRTSVRLYFVEVAGLKPSGGTCVFVSARQTCLMLPSCPCSHPLHCLPGSTVSSNLVESVPSAMPLRETPVLADYFGPCTQTAVFNACM